MIVPILCSQNRKTDRHGQICSILWGHAKLFKDVFRMDGNLNFDCYSLWKAMVQKVRPKGTWSPPPKLLFQKLILGEVYRPYLKEVFELSQKLEVNVGATWNFATTRKNIRKAFNVKLNSFPFFCEDVPLCSAIIRSIVCFIRIGIMPPIRVSHQIWVHIRETTNKYLHKFYSDL